MTRAFGTTAGALLASAAMAWAPVAQAKDRYVAPYVELGQAVVADLSGPNDDVVTYTSVAAGVDAGVQTRNAEGQISYRYEHRFSWDDRYSDEDIHSGLARISTKLAPGIAFDAGGIATRTRSDIRGAAPGNLFGNADNLTQVYSAYLGPTVSTRAGPFDVGGSYRFGYTHAEASSDAGRLPGEPRLDSYNEATNHLAQASIGVPVGRVAPFGVTLSGAYEREDAHQLDQKYEGYYGRGDVVVPVSPTVALRAGVGYEKIKATQRDALLDANGAPVTDSGGRYVTDPNSPERIAYNTDGLIYDAGVIWRPNPRFELQANAGYRYGGETYFGSLRWQTSRDSGIQVRVYDSIESFGRQLRDGLSSMPLQFQTSVNPFGTQFAGCVFGANPGTGGAGRCFDDVFQSISTANYRARGIDAVYSFTRGRSSWGLGGGYVNRKLYAPDFGDGIRIDGIEDESAYAQLFWARRLSRVSSLDVNLYGNWYSSGLLGSQDVWGGGATATYGHNFGRLGTGLSAGIFAYDQGDLDTQVSAQALVNARYTF